MQKFGANINIFNKFLKNLRDKGVKFEVFERNFLSLEWWGHGIPKIYITLWDMALIYIIYNILGNL